MTHDELIVALESAPEGCRGLDYAIHEFLCERDDAIPGPRFYTTSLEAALTLIPEGMSWMLVMSHGHSEQPAARVWDADEYYGTEDFPDRTDMFAPTEALAVCIAAVRARTSDSGVP